MGPLLGTAMARLVHLVMTADFTSSCCGFEYHFPPRSFFSLRPFFPEGVRDRGKDAHTPNTNTHEKRRGPRAARRGPRAARPGPRAARYTFAIS